MGSGGGIVPFPENLAELMNSGSAPNVTLQVGGGINMSTIFSLTLPTESFSRLTLSQTCPGFYVAAVELF